MPRPGNRAEQLPTGKRLVFQFLFEQNNFYIMTVLQRPNGNAVVAAVL
jgi:hypothetical protein